MQGNHPRSEPRKNWCRAKIVEKCRNYFWHFLTIFYVFCPARQMSKGVENIFDTFWCCLTWPLSVGPFGGPLTREGKSVKQGGKAKEDAQEVANFSLSLWFMFDKEYPWAKQLRRGLTPDQGNPGSQIRADFRSFLVIFGRFRPILVKNGQDRLEVGSCPGACSTGLAVWGRGSVTRSQVTKPRQLMRAIGRVHWKYLMKAPELHKDFLPEGPA